MYYNNPYCICEHVYTHCSYTLLLSFDENKTTQNNWTMDTFIRLIAIVIIYLIYV